MPPVRINYYSITKKSKAKEADKKDDSKDKEEKNGAAGSSKDNKLEVSERIQNINFIKKY